MAVFHVQRQCWQRWPRVLIMERTNDDGSKEERRYVPECNVGDQWKEQLFRKISGIRWGLEERDELIRDMYHMLVGHAVDQYVDEDEWENVESMVNALRIEL